jgi:hypothetical protein
MREKMKRVFSEEHIRHLSESHRGYKMSSEQRKKISLALAGKPKSEEHSLNMSKARRGVPLSGAHRQKISKIMRELGARPEVKLACGRRAQASWKSPAYREKYQKTIKGKRDQRGPITRYNGYLMVRKPEHPHANGRGYVFLHRLIIEQSIGRVLEPKEVGHHIDGNVKNNHRENLMLLPGNAEHRRIHSSKGD